MDETLREKITRRRAEHVVLLDRFLDEGLADLERLAEESARVLRGGGKMLLFGNGGSAAQAQHLAAELVTRYDRERRALAAIALTADGAVLTSVANDIEPLFFFARQIEALGRPGDLALAISTSGASPNVIEGLRAARRAGLHAAALLGRDGGRAAREADLAVVVPGTSTARIQEIQLFAAHELCRRIEGLLDLDLTAEF